MAVNLGLVASAIGNFSELAIIIGETAKDLAEDVEVGQSGLTGDARHAIKHTLSVK